MADLVNASAQAIADALAPTPQAPAARWRWGSVVSVNADGTMNVSIGGATVPGIRAAQHVMGAQVGDRVRVLYLGTEAMVDAVRASSLLLNLPTTDLHSTNLTNNVVPDATTYGNGRLYFRDSGNAVLGMLQPVFTTGGRQGMRCGAYRTVGGTNYANMVFLYVNSDGSKTVSFSSNGGKEAWLDALGLSTQSVSFSANTTNWTTNTTNVYRSGNVVSVTLTGQAKAGVGTWQNETYTIGTLGVGANAFTEIVAMAQINSNFTPILCAVHDDGKIYLRTAATAIPANTWMWISGTYITA